MATLCPLNFVEDATGCRLYLNWTRVLPGIDPAMVYLVLVMSAFWVKIKVAT